MPNTFVIMNFPSFVFIEDKQQLEALLRIAENDPYLEISNVDEEVGSKVGENFISVVVRMTVSGKTGDGNG